MPDDIELMAAVFGSIHDQIHARELSGTLTDAVEYSEFGGTSYKVPGRHRVLTVHFIDMSLEDAKCHAKRTT